MNHNLDKFLQERERAREREQMLFDYFIAFNPLFCDGEEKNLEQTERRPISRCESLGILPY